MTNKTWKSRERQVARFFNTQRTPLSGGASGHTRSDSLHKELFIECKLRKKHSAVSLWDKVNVMAVNEGKVPVIALCELNRDGFWVMLHCKDLRDVAEFVPVDKSVLIRGKE